jgi:hypothetical protein
VKFKKLQNHRYWLAEDQPETNNFYRCLQPSANYREGNTRLIFQLLDLIARPAALVPERGVNLARFHDVSAPDYRRRAFMPSSTDNAGKTGRKGKYRACRRTSGRCRMPRRRDGIAGSSSYLAGWQSQGVDIINILTRSPCSLELQRRGHEADRQVSVANTF